LENQMNGNGTMHYASGGRYQGEFVNGLQHGQGTFFYANGDRYVGPWANGKQEGMGTYYPVSGNPEPMFFTAGVRTG